MRLSSLRNSTSLKSDDQSLTDTDGKFLVDAAIFVDWKRILTEVLSIAFPLSLTKLYDRSRPGMDNSLPQVRQAKAAR